MKVIFVKDYTKGSTVLKPGQVAEIITSDAELLIDQGICEATDSATSQANISKAGADVSEDIMDNLPEAAADIVKLIPNISNTNALEQLEQDDRVTVSNAATARLVELND